MGYFSSVLSSPCILMTALALCVTNVVTYPVQACHVTAPCHCGSSYISCVSKNLTKIPEILPLGHQVPSMSVHLQDNRLTRIDTGVFQNLTSSNSSQITIDLSNNILANIDYNAFDGIENCVITLELQKNNLTTLPQAIGTLTKLKVLIITSNPLTSLDSHVMAAFGGSLQAFYVDMGNFQFWPRELHLLRTLNTLSIENLQSPYIPYNGFAGHENHLQHLTISNSHLEYIPGAICRLTNLRDLTFQDNDYLDDQNIALFEPCPHALDSVANVNLPGNSLQKFPAGLFDLFPNVNHINLENNSLYYIREQDLPSQNSLTMLNLNANNFTRIPFALNKLTSMHFLTMENNNIQTIDAPLDIANLKILLLNGNPVVYVHPDAFASMSGTLSHIYFADSNLDHIPEAVTKISSLNYLSITGPDMDCTCTSMDYLRTWYVNNITISAGTRCEISNEPVKHYLQNYLPNCP